MALRSRLTLVGVNEAFKVVGKHWVDPKSKKEQEL